jgi:hypothetical protein
MLKFIQLITTENNNNLKNPGHLAGNMFKSIHLFSETF